MRRDIFPIRWILFALCFSNYSIHGGSAEIDASGNPQLFHETKQKVLPSQVDNSKKPYLRPVFNQLGESCGEAAGTGMAFTYEINAARKLSATVPENQYPYCYTYHFLNEGQDTNGTNDPRNGWRIIRENGIPCVADFGGFMKGYPTRWVSGYDTYYHGMQNRISDYFEFKANTPQGLTRMKQWLYDHGDGSESGGVLNFGANTFEVYTQELPQGTPQAGKSIVLQWGLFTGHCLTVVGYDDSVRFDVNDDGKYTNDLDITGDSTVDMKDWEIGAVYFVNTWGMSWGDSGFSYMLYRSLALTEEESGILNDGMVYGIRVFRDYKPKATFKITLTHNQRSGIRIIPGVSPDIQAETPSLRKLYEHQFNHAGGRWPMQGSDADSAIELGLDVTDLLDSIRGNSARFFLQIESTGGTGRVDSFSLLDYRGGFIKEIRCPQKNVTILPGSTATLSILWTDSIGIESGAKLPRTNSWMIVRKLKGIVLITVNDFQAAGSAGAITVFDSRGRQIRDLNLLKGDKGSFKAKWDCRDDNGNLVAPGVYLLRCHRGNSEMTGRVLIEE